MFLLTPSFCFIWLASPLRECNHKLGEIKCFFIYEGQECREHRSSWTHCNQFATLSRTIIASSNVSATQSSLTEGRLSQWDCESFTVVSKFKPSRWSISTDGRSPQLNFPRPISGWPNSLTKLPKADLQKTEL